MHCLDCPKLLRPTARLRCCADTAEERLQEAREREQARQLEREVRAASEGGSMNRAARRRLKKSERKDRG